MTNTNDERFVPSLEWVESDDTNQDYCPTCAATIHGWDDQFKLAKAMHRNWHRRMWTLGVG